MKVYHHLLLRIFQFFLILSVGSVWAAPTQQLSFGHYCADVYTALKSGSVCDEIFSAFVERIIFEKTALSPRDWETIASLTRQYIQIRIKQEDRSTSKDIIRKLLSVVTMPSHIRSEIRLAWQKLNPDGVSLRDLITQFHSIERGRDTLEDNLLLELYSMTLHSSYEDRKQEILVMQERGNYDEALALCEKLSQAIATGTCSPHPDVIDIEKNFLKKIVLGLKIKKSREVGDSCESLLLPYCQSEKDYAQSIDNLVLRISRGEVQRAHEVDVFLLAHALYTLPWNQKKGIRELEVLIDQGNYLQSTLLYYGYFSLLEIYHQEKNLSAMRRLLLAGESVFVPEHKYFPEYSFFLGCYSYEKQDFTKSREIFVSILDHASRLGVTLSRVYEYLGCISCYEQKYSDAEDFFLLAYKSWSRKEAGLGLFLSYALQKKIDLCEELNSKSHVSFLHRKILKSIDALFLKKDPSFVSPVVKLCESLGSSEVALEDLYHYFIYDMINRYRRRNASPILALIDHQIDITEQLYLQKTLEQSQNPEYSRVLTLWLAFRRGELFKEATYTTRLSFSSSFEDIAKCCFSALYYRDPQASSALTNIFSQARSALQSTVRLVWALTRIQSNQELLDLYCYRLDLRLYGDRLYLLAYDIDDYLSGKENALLHLSCFQELFPHSSLLSLVYYFQGHAETEMIRKIGWFIKALDEFSEITLCGENAKAWVYVYYTLKLDLADAYLSLGDAARAVKVFEEVKGDWETPNHPQVVLIEEINNRVAMEMRWVSGLACAYEKLNEKDKLTQHLLDHVEKRLLEMSSRREYFREMITTTLSLCERFLPLDSSNSLIG
ncbi:DNA-binding protein [Chlamydia buteonis]|uniref:DNA-binding protein n=1 Tax=Chlamydia buteonis TaxID=2494525 RepID=A0ABX8LGV8_9CHLA|nr:DNA-binding protein [Chlamydia buteonis]QXE26776.1 DNA-binding protein [Chlamydia buteonis]QXE28272.1 DNA-binding protein [Chlamydia buteonis]